MINLKLNHILFVIIFFLFSRFFIYYFLQIQPSYPSGQIIDHNFLRENLLDSLINLHFQPFLWNLIFGIMFKFFDQEFVYILSYPANIIISLFIAYYLIKILESLKLSNKIIFFTVLFFLFNPNTIFYEQYAPHYAHFSLLMMTQLLYFFIKFNETKNFRYEVLSYVNLLVMSYIWVLFSFLTIIFIFITCRFIKRDFKKKNFLFFFIFIILSLIPYVKNKVIFNIFSAGSWTGIQLALATYPTNECTLHHYQSIAGINFKETKDFSIYDSDVLYNKKLVDQEIELYSKIFNRSIKAESAISYQAMNNNVGLIYRSKKCLQISLTEIINNPHRYINRIKNFFLSSHSKFAFEHDIKPINWKLNFIENEELKPYKKIKQFILLLYMVFFYMMLLHSIFKKNGFISPNVAFFLLSFNTYIVGVSHFMAGYEAERMMYTMFVGHVLFISVIIKKLFYNEKK
jgi:hypothetical protein